MALIVSWITIYCLQQDEKWSILERLEREYENNLKVFIIARKHNYDPNDEVEFITHAFMMLGRLLRIITECPSVIVIGDTSLDQILHMLKNSPAHHLAKSLDECFSVEKIGQLRTNQITFFPNETARKDFENRGFSKVESHTTLNNDDCINEIKKFVNKLTAGNFQTLLRMTRPNIS